MQLTARALCFVSAFALAPCVREPRRRPLADARASGGTAATAPDASLPDVLITGESAVAPEGLAGVIEAVRHEDWPAARARWDRLESAEQQRREGRYVGGRIALAQGDGARAALLFHDLGAAFPALTDDIDRREAQALALAGRHEESRRAYERLAVRTHLGRDRAQAAEEALAAGDTRAAADAMRAWTSDPPAGIDRARAFRHAAQTMESVGDTPAAVRAWKRLVIEEPDAASVPDALAALQRLGAALTVDETLSRADHLNDRARYDAVIAELTALAAAAGAPEARRLHLLGRAYFHSRAHYAEAHTTLAAAGERSDNADRDEDAFLAARALARSDRDDDAIVSYDQVAQRVHGRWSDEAAFRALWLVAHHDRVDQAVVRARAYLHDRGDAAPQQRSEVAWEAGWALFSAGRFHDAIEWLDTTGQLATRALERGRGRYWSAMASLREGNPDAAVHTWQALIADRPLTWYALLAESRLRERGVTVPPPAEPAPRRPAPPLALPDNVRWLRALGFEREGGALLSAQEDRLRARLPADRADEVIALAYLELGEEHRAYTIAQRHNDFLDHEPTPETRWIWDCAYPRPYSHWVEAAEDQNHLPRQYLYAIMRQESAFNTRDVSNARAMGLLQMIPPTTRRVAETLHIEWREELLYEPEYNIRVGGYYIGRLFAQYRGVLPRAIGAFNAGPGAMGRWVTRWPDAPVDDFVERIPFDETHTYVRRVIQNLARYRYLYGPRDAQWPLRVELDSHQTVEPIVDY
ncbi:MAG: lytic transglycosylase domain-containing protein [Deltaproteobacteria bacterium]